MVPLLDRLEAPLNMLNPWGETLLPELRPLELSPHSRVLDVPCGSGGVAVMVAREFGARVRGIDLLPGHVEKAMAHAERAGCDKLCEFSVGDLRECLDAERGYDAVLWIAAPHVWEDSAAAIRALRGCVRRGGTIFVADAYRPAGIPEALCPGYQSFDDATAGFANAGDLIAQAADLTTDWERDYRETRRAASQLLATLVDPGERRVARRYLDDLDEAQSRESVGCAVWRVIRRDG